VLRQAVFSDVSDIQRIRHAVRENRLASTSISDEQVREAIEKTGRGWVIESEGEVVAFGIATAKSGNIWALFVHPTHERRGYGRLLHDTMVQWLFSRGLERLWLTTEPDTRAQRFYEAAAWERIGLTDSGEVRFELRALHQSAGAMHSDYDVRIARPEDAAAVDKLLQVSYPELMASSYDSKSLAPALKLMTRANASLLGSGTYYMAELSTGLVVGCGGWTLERPGTGTVEPHVGHIRHFATHPDWTRRGVGRAIYRQCENAARSAGVMAFECYSSLNAKSFYSALGFESVREIDVDLQASVVVRGVLMRRQL
jgi:GNAT superfamily N-acetyltransferase